MAASLAAAVAAFPGAVPSPLAAQDTIVVRADNPPVWGASPKLVEEMRIGVLEGDERYALGAVEGVAVMPDDGTVWVADTQLGAVRRYDARGAYIGQVGRKGEGPGEFMYPWSMRVLPDGRVAVWDAGLQRLNLFGADGAFSESWAQPSGMITLGPGEELETDRDGRLYLIAMEDVAGRRAMGDFFWRVIGADGQPVDSVYMAPHDGEWMADAGLLTETIVSPLGYVATARLDQYAFTRAAPDGRTVRIERSWDPVAYESDERAEKRRLEQTWAERNGRSPRDVPPHKPALADVSIDAEGRFWARLRAPGVREGETPGERGLRESHDGPLQEWREPFLVDVIEPNGRYLGRLRFPNRRTKIEVARGMRVWVVERGDFEEPYVVRYRVVPGGA